MIRKIYQKNPNAKTLIFAATKADTEWYADFLSKQASDIFGPVTEDEEFRQTMADIERDYHSPLYEDELLPALRAVNPDLPQAALDELLRREQQR